MSFDFISAAQEWFDNLRYGIIPDATLQTWIEYLLLLWLSILLCLTIGKGIIYVFRQALEMTKAVAKIIGLLTVLVLGLMILRMVLDSNRLCQSPYEKYLTRCQLVSSVTQSSPKKPVKPSSPSKPPKKYRNDKR